MEMKHNHTPCAVFFLNIIFPFFIFWLVVRLIMYLKYLCGNYKGLNKVLQLLSELKRSGSPASPVGAAMGRWGESTASCPGSHCMDQPSMELQ